jgi:(p)ppGpp synthase/HD superfamily hydrolase
MTETGVLHSPTDQPGVLGEPFTAAVAWAAELHREQHRKGKPDVPYLSHLLGVASLVLEGAGTETEAIAALLHDAIEDQGVTVQDIVERFGDRVAHIVLACTDDLTGDDQPEPAPVAPRGAANWRARKEQYLTHLRTEHDAGVLRVSLADKLHNARALLADVRADPETWVRFNADPESQLGYYRSLVDAFASVPEADAFLLRELGVAVSQLVAATDLGVAGPAWAREHSD